MSESQAATALHPLFVTTPLGIEPLLADELRTIGASEVREGRGGVHAAGDWATACRIVLWSRVANRVLRPLARVPITDADSLYQQARTIDWLSWFDVKRTIAIEVAGHSAAITHTQYAGLKLKDAIVDSFREKLGERPSVDTEKPDVTIHLHLEREHATLSLDLSGGSLHQRGYRKEAREAPMKENLAAAILLRAGWPQLAAAGAPLLDPLCGSGTLVIEAAMMAADLAPGLLRLRFGGAALTPHQPVLWRDLIEEARKRRDAGLEREFTLIGQDVDAEALRIAAANAKRAGIGNKIEWRSGDLADAAPVSDQPGLVIANPPYGVRLGSEAELIKLYSLLGASLRERFGGWKAALFTARPDLTPRLGLRAHKLYALKNGPIDCKLLLFDIAQQATAPTAAGETRPDEAADFANRLRKNLQNLGRWAKRTGVSCYRLYDADLPDYALAIDLYQSEELHVHVQEYAAPKTVDPVRAERRLRAALAVIHDVLQVPAARIHYKLRQAQKGDAQYQRQAEAREFHAVDEHGCKLLVNFVDYLDTGLFLDHRPIRKRIQSEAAGQRFLNLFCYTGTATVHAARGGAATTCSVDLSANYLEWARRNLETNDIAANIEAAGAAAQTAWRGPRTQLPKGRAHAHRLLRADCLAWLREQAGRSSPPQFDLIFCDPPTFSNSKRMTDVLDVQRDHIEMIRNCAALLAPEGKLYFSTNRKRFKLDEEALQDFEIRDITAQTLDEDFKRPPPPHRCWLIRFRAASADGG
jgi:23S rRNA (guanine2445-N2)-methyltransferase / 23S rRNA (guanine2069-N7)-methyltransferase